MERDFNAALAPSIDALTRGPAPASQIMILVGWSSTGKTRACWEAVCRLPRFWRLWHPLTPEELIAETHRITRHTIIWLDETNNYLNTPDVRLGRQVATQLRDLLRDTSLSPVLIIGSMWPNDWDNLTRRPQGGEPDLNWQARGLLSGSDIEIPRRFSSEEMNLLRRAAQRDPRLGEAARLARDGAVTQILAGVPDLVARYRRAAPIAAALLHVNMDLRRMGHPRAIAYALLAGAAPGYLSDDDWNVYGVEGWLNAGLGELGQPAHDMPGPLTCIRQRPRNGNMTDGQDLYQLAESLDEIGRTERAAIFPPTALWDTIAASAAKIGPDLLRTFSRFAKDRCRFQRAAQFCRLAADHGDLDAMRELAWWRWEAGDTEPAERAIREIITRGDASALLTLAGWRRKAGDVDGAEQALREAVDHGYSPALLKLPWWWRSLGEAHSHEHIWLPAIGNRGFTLTDLAEWTWRSGDAVGAERLIRDATTLGDCWPLSYLAEWRYSAGDINGAEQLIRETLASGNTVLLLSLAEWRRTAGDTEGAEQAIREAVDRGFPYALVTSALWRREGGDVEGAERAIWETVDRGDPTSLMMLADWRRETGDTTGAEQIVREAAERGVSAALCILAERQWAAGHFKPATELIQKAVNFGDKTALEDLAGWRHAAGDTGGAEQAIREAVDRGYEPALVTLASWRRAAGDNEAAERALREAIDRGYDDALEYLADWRHDAGDSDGAELATRHGLADDGSISEPWERP